MWNHNWTKNLVLSDEFDVFPLQFANAERIESNDAVFIFDEVGCGKTISAGLMALNYLHNTKTESVQIITINSLVRPIPDHTYGQFLNDWFEKLPFFSLGWDKRISICNNHYKNINRVAEAGKVGLLIIDEAHLFLEDSKRREALRQIRAEKVVFLTATPIKYFSHYNLNNYSEIASSVLMKEVNINWDNELNMVNDTQELKPICSRFDLSSPVSRYFKDTVTALEYADDGVIQFEKRKVKRLIPQIWDFDAGRVDGKVESLIHEILKRPYDKSGKKNRFVIFTRYISRESDYIETEFLKRKEFISWKGENQPSKLSVVNINGETMERATAYSHNGTNKELPDIMIITYQIAEQGINLPGYNYVINYHISAFPASLEQRFGRIDRMGKKNPSQYDEINMVFLLSNNGCETYKSNFYTAVSIYRNYLITSIPAKNVLLTKEILTRFRDDEEIVKKYIEDLEQELNDSSELRQVFDYLLICNNKDNQRRENDPQRENDNRKEEDYPNNKLTEFCVENGISIEPYETIEDLRTVILGELMKLKERYTSKELADDVQIFEILDTIGDKIYSFTNSDTGRLVTIDAISDCAQQIYNSDSYRAYEKKFYEEVKLPKVIEKWKDKLEEFFERMFLEGNGKFDKIFPESGNYGLLLRNTIMKEGEWIDINTSEKKLLCDNADIVVAALPFFKMIQRYKYIIREYLYNQAGYMRMKYDFNLLLRSFNTLKRMGYIPERILENTVGHEETIFRTYQINGNYECSNWLKLFYICMDANALKYLQFVNRFKILAQKADERWYALQKKLHNEDIVIYKTIEEMLHVEYKNLLEELVSVIAEIGVIKCYISISSIFFLLKREEKEESGENPIGGGIHLTGQFCFPLSPRAEDIIKYGI